MINLKTFQVCFLQTIINNLILTPCGDPNMVFILYPTEEFYLLEVREYVCLFSGVNLNSCHGSAWSCATKTGPGRGLGFGFTVAKSAPFLGPRSLPRPLFFTQFHPHPISPSRIQNLPPEFSPESCMPLTAPVGVQHPSSYQLNCLPFMGATRQGSHVCDIHKAVYTTGACIRLA